MAYNEIRTINNIQLEDIKARQSIKELDNKKANKSDIVNGLNYKGTTTYSALPTSGNRVGDFYYVTDGDGTNGEGNYAWNGSAWYFSGKTTDFGDISTKANAAVNDTAFDEGKLKVTKNDGTSTETEVIDSSLTKSGKAADAKITGDNIGQLKDGIVDVDAKVDANAAAIGAWTDGYGQTTIAEVVNYLTTVNTDTRAMAEDAMANARKAIIKVAKATAAIGDWEDEHPEQTISECVTSIENEVADVESTANATKGVVDKIIDPTLSVSGKAADAAKVGEAVNAETERAKGVESQIKEDLECLLNNTENVFEFLTFINLPCYNYNGDAVTNSKWLLSNAVSICKYKFISVRLIESIVTSPVVFFTETMEVLHIVQRSEFYKIDSDNLGSCYGFIKVPESAKYVKFSTYIDYKDSGMIKFYKEIPNKITVATDNTGDIFSINAAMSLYSNGDNINLTLAPGVYEETVHFENKYNSVIVKGESRDECVIIDESGVYKNSALVVMGNFLLENLTIKATINKAGTWFPTYDESDVNGTFPSYALHIDGRSLNPESYAYGTVRNCIIYSNSFPAVGMGLNKNQTVAFENCDFVRMCTDERYKKDNWRGAFLCHNSVDSGYVENQKLILNGCRFISNYGYSCHIRGSLDVDDSSQHFTLLAINNQFESSDLNGIDLCKYEKGNSVLDLMSGLNGSANLNAYHNSKVAYDYENVFNLSLNFTVGSLQNNSVSPSVGWVISPYLIPVLGSELKYYANTVGGIVQLFVFYDDNLDVVESYSPSDASWASGTYTVPNNSNIKYMRTCMNLSDGQNGYVRGKFKMC